MVSYSDFLINLRYCLSAYVESKRWYPNTNAHAYIHFEISENTWHIQLRKINCLKNSIMYIPLSAIHVQVPHKIFSSLKLLNPWLSLQNPRRWTTAKSRTSISNTIALHMSRITFFHANRNEIESYYSVYQWSNCKYVWIKKINLLEIQIQILWHNRDICLVEIHCNFQ